ncbi:hypothetical protein [Haloarchaeobius sp. DFWS5]|uniref:hypothetical protein n=1 Tax=Haloarchaeobius sp. DFWS5 TaxID=3446114 RepID=UPI003EBA15B7
MRQNFLSVLLALDTILLVLLVVGFQFTEPGTPAHAISQASLVVIILTMLGLVVAIRQGIPFYEP